MASDGGVAAKLAAAKKTLSDVAHSNVSPAHSPYAPKQPSYAVAHEARKSGGIADEAKSAGEGIAARMKNEADAKASLQQ